ncbi:hypothetical protein AGR9A_Lc40550 [Agrobacterium salinitolerans str. Hayward 0363]|nr:hypothetical protein AGR9A_Lc40550 [Agrobacterium salinitolerans str. Hayward 0363]
MVGLTGAWVAAVSITAASGRLLFDVFAQAVEETMAAPTPRKFLLLNMVISFLNVRHRR